MSDAQQQVQQAIDDLVESGAELGLQVAAYRDGEWPKTCSPPQTTARSPR